MKKGESTVSDELELCEAGGAAGNTFREEKDLVDIEKKNLLNSEAHSRNENISWLIHFYSANNELLGTVPLPFDQLKISDEEKISDLKVIPVVSDEGHQNSPSRYLLQYYEHSSGLHKAVQLPDAVFQAIPKHSSSFSVVVESVSNKSSVFEKYLKLISFCFLIIGMIAIASGGIAYKLLPPDVKYRPLLACLWRTEATLLCILPPTIYQFFKMKDKTPLKEGKTWSKIIVAGVCVSVWTGTFAVALNYTSLTRVYLLNNCQPLLIVVYNKFTGKVVNLYHIIGVSLGFLGLALSCIAGTTNEGIHSIRSELIGDTIAFIGSISAAIYISLGPEVRAKVPSFLYLMPVTIVSFIIYIFCTLVLENSPISMLFSWYKPVYLPTIAWLAVVTGLLGTAVITIVMKHLPSLLISVVLLAEPVVATILAIIFKVESTPSWLTWFGAALVTLGVTLVSLGFGGKAVLSCWHHRAKLFKKLYPSSSKKPTYEKLETLDDPPSES